MNRFNLDKVKVSPLRIYCWNSTSAVTLSFVVSVLVLGGGILGSNGQTNVYSLTVEDKFWINFPYTWWFWVIGRPHIIHQPQALDLDFKPRQCLFTYRLGSASEKHNNFQPKNSPCPCALRKKHMWKTHVLQKPLVGFEVIFSRMLTMFARLAGSTYIQVELWCCTTKSNGHSRKACAFTCLIYVNLMDGFLVQSLTMA